MGNPTDLGFINRNRGMEQEFFADCHDERSINRQYRRLAARHHPDHGGDHRIMQQINAARQAALLRVRARQAGPQSRHRADPGFHEDRPASEHQQSTPGPEPETESHDNPQQADGQQSSEHQQSAPDPEPETGSDADSWETWTREWGQHWETWNRNWGRDWSQWSREYGNSTQP